MFHRIQTQNFRTSEAPLGGSFYSFLLRPRFQYLNAGDLLEYLMGKLWGLTGVRTDRVDFTLVNVCSPFTKFSHGSSAEPPHAALPTGKILVFTFAVSPMQKYDGHPYYKDLVGREHVRIHDNQTRQWSTVKGQIDFVSVSVNAVTAHALGLQQPKSNELEYLYNLIGAASKSIIRHQTVYDPDDSFEDVHEQLNLHDQFNRLYHMPITQLFKTVPYHLWAFSGELWRRAPNMIAQRMITPAVALYYFMALTGDCPLIGKCSRDVSQLRLGLVPGIKGGVLAHLTSSVLDMAQMLRAPDSELTSQQMIAPAVMAALLRTGDNALPNKSMYAAVFAGQAQALAQALSDSTSTISDLFFPPQDAARALMFSDPDFIEQMRSVLDTGKPKQDDE